jgi:hypothetical protein
MTGADRRLPEGLAERFERVNGRPLIAACPPGAAAGACRRASSKASCGTTSSPSSPPWQAGDRMRRYLRSYWSLIQRHPGEVLAVAYEDLRRLARELLRR